MARGGKLRIALLGFRLESNGHAPVMTEEDFESHVVVKGDALLADIRSDHPRGATEFCGFASVMDEVGDWEQIGRASCRERVFVCV